ncbi:hypothetical protein HU200_065003 [Digitaria exilis]|uniref:Uncharacterized protein n=1 Tax=Digitaria exilis TaxID=1010633 RepID=A0A835A4J9_9POAL|nr:hypothetical protein HU200_065003 [Digitaria exilis]
MAILFFLLFGCLPLPAHSKYILTKVACHLIQEKCVLVLSHYHAKCCTNLKGRPGLLEIREATRPNGLTNTGANATAAISSLDESKLKLIFCIEPQLCVHPAPCYCCVQPEKCYYTMEKCRANCLTCSPNCGSQPPPAKEDRLVHALTEPAEP